MKSIFGIIALLLYDILYIIEFLRSKPKNRKSYIFLFLLIILSVIIAYSLFCSISN